MTFELMDNGHVRIGTPTARLRQRYWLDPAAVHCSCPGFRAFATCIHLDAFLRLGLYWQPPVEVAPEAE